MAPPLLAPHDAGALEHCDVLGDALQRHMERAREITGCAGVLSEPGHDPASAGIRKSLENVRKAAFGKINHMVEFSMCRRIINHLVEFFLYRPAFIGAGLARGEVAKSGTFLVAFLASPDS